MTTTPKPKQVHQWFTGPWVELTIEPGIVVMVGRSREVEDAVAIVTGTFDATLTAVQAML